jgi:hypothetical protein
MVAKKVDLGPGLNFESIAQAGARFGPILEDTLIEQRVTDADSKV